MSKYRMINEPHNLNVIVKLIRNGFLSPNIIRKINIYDKFYQMEGTKMEKYKALAEEYNLSAYTVRKLITNLNRKSK